ncbi:transglycosylase domain-containing protein [Oceanobacillus polygoni]|uniref:1A family penicillin-binding protein n=1 Tax=Oceanobacillus polygoni TaxID=1235259 RepID=A0A9X0YSA6_9BACI|nr:transglycosylase domain-containing protein [Oceanobacillus polygoni]MBP2076259.1 1A family penicillin-binding protein [Oceanobacillus polygoni]
MRFFPKKFLYKIILTLISIGVFTIAAIYLAAFLLGPPKLANDQATIIYDREEEVISEQHGGLTKHWISLDEISPAIIDATLQTEDQHFFEHQGFDLKRIAGAIMKNIRNSSLKEGASTISQQYARNLYLSPEKTWTRKLTEAFYTIRLEMFYSKEEILEGYLNTIYYGHGAYGIEAASHYFFDKEAKALSLAEATMLVGIPKGPTYYSPLNNEENANRRQQQILKHLLDEKYISEAAYVEAIEEELNYSITPEPVETAPHFQDTVLQEAALLLDLSADEVRAGGFRIYTTLNREYQQNLEEQVRATINPSSEVETAAIAMDPASGAILSLIGGKDYAESAYNRAMSSKRMSGSTFKPILYYAALQYGYTPSTKLMSKPTSFALGDGNSYQPSNFNGYYANKPITLAQALALSDNVYAVKTNMYLGPETLIETAREFGLRGDFPAVPALALGTASVSVKEMTSAYGMLANGGRSISGYTVEKITDRNGKVVYEHEDISEQVLDSKKAFILTHLMTGMFDVEMNGYTSVTGATIAKELSRLYAGKSGTTDSDSWMIGYSPSLVTGIWVGYDDNRNMELVAESAYAKEMWAGFMEYAHEGMAQDVFAMPSGVVGIPIDPETGARATPNCDASRIMYFEKGTEPRNYCSEHPVEEEGVNEDDKGFFERWFDLFN